MAEPPQKKRRVEEAKPDEAELVRLQENSVFVSGLASNATQEAVATFFATCGVLVSCDVTQKQGSDAVFAFVEFAAPDAVDAALKRTGALLQGKKISVQRKKSKGGAAAKLGKEKSVSVFVKFMDETPPKQDVLYKVFEMCGKIKELRMHTTNKFCFVEYFTIAASTLATQMADARFQVHFSTKQGDKKDAPPKASVSLFKPRALRK